MPQRIDLVGQRLGKLTVVKEIGKKDNRPLWECVCDCGETVYLIAAELRRRKTPQCRECSILDRTNHGCSSTTRGRETAEYRSWNSARRRCLNPDEKHYAHYGGRGILFCSGWDDFNVFLRDMGPRPKGHTLDRIDVNGHYEPGNCRWATPKMQSNNRRNNVVMTYQGKTLTVTGWADFYGQPKEYFRNALASGYEMGEIVARIESGQQRKKLKYRCEHSKAAKLTRSQVNALVAEYHATPNVGSRKPKGFRQMLAAKYRIDPRYVTSIVSGKTHWTEEELAAILARNLAEYVARGGIIK